MLLTLSSSSEAKDLLLIPPISVRQRAGLLHHALRGFARHFLVPAELWPRRDERSPRTSPSDAPGVTISTSSSGSSSTGLHLGATALKAWMPAMRNDSSFESTVWYEPS